MRQARSPPEQGTAKQREPASMEPAIDINRHDTLSKPRFEPLEPRELLSADPVGTDADAQMPDPGQEAVLR